MAAMREVEHGEQRAGECIVRVVADTAQVPMVGPPAAGFLGSGVRAALPVHGAACSPSFKKCARCAKRAISEPTKCALVINRKTAKALGSPSPRYTSAKRKRCSDASAISPMP